MRGSVTRLGGRVRELEETAEESGTPELAKQLVAKLGNLDKEFKVHHFQLIDLVDAADVGTLEREQEVLDKLDDDITALTVRLQQVLSARSDAPSHSVNRKTLFRRQSHLEKKLESADEALSEGHEDVSLVEQYQEQLADYKGELGTIYENLLSSGIDDGDDLVVLHTRLVGNCSVHAVQARPLHLLQMVRESNSPNLMSLHLMGTY